MFVSSERFDQHGLDGRLISRELSIEGSSDEFLKKIQNNYSPLDRNVFVDRKVYFYDFEMTRILTDFIFLKKNPAMETRNVFENFLKLAPFRRL
jgi:hypothetical protein